MLDHPLCNPPPSRRRDGGPVLLEIDGLALDVDSGPVGPISIGPISIGPISISPASIGPISISPNTLDPTTLRSPGAVVPNVRAPPAEPVQSAENQAFHPHSQSSARPELAVILGMSSTGLAAMRLLGQNGVRCWGVDVQPDQPGFASRYCERRILMREVSAAELERVLHDIAAITSSRPVVLPTTDRLVRLLSAVHDPLRARFHVALPAADLVADILDKQRFATLAAQVGLRVPRSVSVMSMAGIKDAILQVCCPVLVKPRAPEQGGAVCPKAALLESAADLCSLQTRYPELSGPELIVQEYVPGDDLHHISVAVALDTHSHPLATFVARKRRQGNHGAGVGTFVESHQDEEAATMAVRFLQEIGYVGVAEVELKRHARTNELFAIEVNPRLWSQAMLPAALGLNFAMLYCQVATGVTPANETSALESHAHEVERGGKTASWQDIWGDFYWTFCHDGYWRRGDVSVPTWLYQTLTSRTGANFAWRNPLPALRTFRQALAGPGKKA